MLCRALFGHCLCSKTDICRLLFGHQIRMCFYMFFLFVRTAGTSKNTVFLQENTCFGRVSLSPQIVKAHGFYKLFAMNFDNFGINVHNIFGIDFCIDFLCHFGRTLAPKWAQRAPKINLNILKNASEINAKKKTLSCTGPAG